MEDEKRARSPEKKEGESEKKIKKEEEIDEELEQTFPASDPPSYSQPGNKEEED